MSALQQTAPGVFLQFEKGLFTVHKTPRRFSAIAIAIDQAHEQNNGMVKGDGGAVGLTENPSAHRRWMISGPEMARLVSEFEASMTTEAEVQGADPRGWGGHFRNFWVVMCRWDSGTLNLY